MALLTEKKPVFHGVPLALKQLSHKRREITFVLLALQFQKVLSLTQIIVH